MLQGIRKRSLSIYALISRCDGSDSVVTIKVPEQWKVGGMNRAQKRTRQKVPLENAHLAEVGLSEWEMEIMAEWEFAT